MSSTRGRNGLGFQGMIRWFSRHLGVVGAISARGWQPLQAEAPIRRRRRDVGQGELGRTVPCASRRSMFDLQGGEDLPACPPLVPLACLDHMSNSEEEGTRYAEPGCGGWHDVPCPDRRGWHFLRPSPTWANQRNRFLLSQFDYDDKHIYVVHEPDPLIVRGGREAAGD